MSDKKLLLAMFDALIYTAKQTTDLENVYNDTSTPSTSFSWADVEKMRDRLAQAVNHPPQFIVYDGERYANQSEAMESGCVAFFEGGNLAKWESITQDFADMPHGYSLPLATERYHPEPTTAKKEA